jgi:hypothetical protein
MIKKLSKTDNIPMYKLLKQLMPIWVLIQLFSNAEETALQSIKHNNHVDGMSSLAI